jgi:hypothetical protein
MQDVHTVGEEQAEQFVGHNRHTPLDKYLPTLQEKQA